MPVYPLGYPIVSGRQDYGTVVTNTLSAYDPDALAYFNYAAGLGVPFTTPQKDAWNTCVVSLKGFSLWTALVSVFPLMGGTATSNSIDAKRLVQGAFFGTVVSNANGITGDGLTGYLDTGWECDLMNQDSMAFGSYSRTDLDGADVDMGVGSTLEILPRLGNTAYFDLQITARITAGMGNSLGLTSVSRTASNSVKGYKNGAVIATGAGASMALPPGNFTLLAAGFGFRYSARNVAFGYVATGLTDQNNADLYTAIQAFQTSLGRQV